MSRTVMLVGLALIFLGSALMIVWLLVNGNYWGGYSSMMILGYLCYIVGNKSQEPPRG